MNLLGLAHSLEANPIKRLAEQPVSKSSSLFTAEKLHFLRNYDAQGLVEDLIISLSLRPKVLTVAKAAMLSHQQLFRVSSLRETMRAQFADPSWCNWLCSVDARRDQFRTCLRSTYSGISKLESLAAMWVRTGPRRL